MIFIFVILTSRMQSLYTFFALYPLSPLPRLRLLILPYFRHNKSHNDVAFFLAKGPQQRWVTSIGLPCALSLHLRYDRPGSRQPTRLRTLLTLRIHHQSPHLREGRSDQTVRLVHRQILRAAGTFGVMQAKTALDGTKLLGAICKMNIYYSNFANVDLKN